MYVIFRQRSPYARRRRVVTLLICLHALLEVLPPCRGGKRQEQQCRKDAFHALIGPLTGGGVNVGAGGQSLILGGSFFPVISRRYFFFRFSNTAIHSCAIAWAFVIWDGFNSLAAKSRYAAPLSLSFAAAI